MRVQAVINPNARRVAELGASMFQEQLADALSRYGVDLGCTVTDGPKIAAAARAALEKRPDAVIAIGGDGTIGSVASVTSDQGAPLGIVPGGTFNLIAKGLRIPDDMNEAARVIAGGVVARLDIGSVNGKKFINNSMIGLHPEFVDEREKLNYREAGQAVISVVTALGRAVRRARGRLLNFNTGEQEFSMRTLLACVSTQDFNLIDGRMVGSFDSLPGQLWLGISRAETPGALLLQAGRRLLGFPLDESELRKCTAERVLISWRRGLLKVSLDGEVEEMRPPLEYRVHTGAMAVIVPPETDGADERIDVGSRAEMPCPRPKKESG